MHALHLTALTFFAAGAAAAQPIITDGWTYERTHDRLTGDVSTKAYTQQNIGLDRIRIEVSCVAYEGLTADVSWPSYIASGETEVRYRFDNKELVEEIWIANAKNRAALTAPDAAMFAWRLINGRELVIEADKDRGDPERIKFGVRRADNEVYRVMRDCRYFGDRIIDDAPIIGDSIGAAFEPDMTATGAPTPERTEPKEGKDVVGVIRSLWPFGKDSDE